MTTTLTDKVKVRNLISKSGREVPNQFDISIGGCRYFQNYDSIIVKIDNTRQIYLDEYYWNYSNTTSKYRNQFLCENTKTTKAKIKSGKYILTNLN